MKQVTLPEKISVKDLKNNRYEVAIEPFYPGYGVTVANSIRRVLLSSLGGAAVVSFKIEGAQHEFDSVEVDIDLNALAGIYSGQTRGQPTSIEIKAQFNSLTISTVGQSEVDTLKPYLGDNTWSDGNNLVKIKNDEYLRDDIYGYIKLVKE